MERPTPVAAPVFTPAPSPALAAPAPSPFAALTPFPAAPTPGFAQTEGALARAPEAIPDTTSSVNTDSLRTAVVAALATAGHNSASQILGTGSWTLEGGGLRIEVGGMGKKMLALTVNAAAEKIIRQELQRQGAPNRFMVVPGEGGGKPGGAAITTPLAGSVEELALAHPLVQHAKDLFKADVRSVIDLRQK